MTLRDAIERIGRPLAAFSGRAAAREAPGAAEAAVALAWACAAGRPVLCVCDGPGSLEVMHRDLLTLSAAAGTLDRTGVPLYFPARETPPRSPRAAPDTRGARRYEQDPDIAGYRLAALHLLAGGARPSSPPPRVIATCVQALMQKTVPPDALARHTLTLAVGHDAPPLDRIAARLDAAGYAIGAEVVEKARAAVRGGILDVWPPTEAWPLRIEFLGAAVESVRAFNPADQKSLRRLDAARVPPADEWAAAAASGGACLLDYMPRDAVFLWSRDPDIRDHAAMYEETVAESGAPETLVSLDALWAALERRDAAHILTGARAEDAGGEAPLPDFHPLARVFEMPGDLFQPDVMETARNRLLRELHARAAEGRAVLVFLDTPGALAHLREAAGKLAGGPASQASPAAWAPSLCLGMLSEGFFSDALGLVVVAESDLYGRRKRLDSRYQPEGEEAGPDRRFASRPGGPADMEPGDLVVHAEHGIARYLGLYEIRLDDRMQEVLTLEYADGAKLHVPVAQASRLTRYVGTPGHGARLHRLGGRRWERDRREAEGSIARLAASMLEIQARRNLMPGHAFAPDRPWQRDFENSFPYHETADQRRVIGEVKKEMEQPKPMDRLVCGDAGYGKTEVAMRAAFKAVMDERQVAVLVPTTVLAQQHFETFTRRMSPFPVRVEMLSRFRSRAQRHGVLRGLAEGAVDVVIGTHSLIQPDIRFRNLGLLIIDEEQRFGVAHKEMLKRAETLVDILTLTATPIPRTLYLSMTGARDMSLLQTPPGERMAIETIVDRNTDAVLREAILRELNREGQAYYLHNRVMTIARAAERVRRVVPEARVEFAHGQMASGDLATAMRRFAAGEFDVLVCTTIVESGTDIPRANTILIDRADRFGVADLYQLRGRVGRSNRKAYAYLLLPPHGPVDPAARKRIGAVERHSGLSAGFGLALRDLEIRGAGNLLGPEQSGHIAAVGFGLYCQMLRQAIARLKGEPPPPVADAEILLDFVALSPAGGPADKIAAVPHDYVEDERLRIAAYRRIAECGTPGDVEAVRAELRDRYGPLPPSAERLLRIAGLRILCAGKGVRRLETRGGRVVLTRGADYLMRDGRFPRLAAGTADGRIAELAALVAGLPPA